MLKTSPFEWGGSERTKKRNIKGRGDGPNLLLYSYSLVLCLCFKTEDILSMDQKSALSNPWVAVQPDLSNRHQMQTGSVPYNTSLARTMIGLGSKFVVVTIRFCIRGEEVTRNKTKTANYRPQLASCRLGSCFMPFFLACVLSQQRKVHLR